MNITRVGVDIAKSVFHIHAVDPSVRIVAPSLLVGSNNGRGRVRGFERDIPVPKASVLSKMLPLNNRSIADLGKDEGILDATLYNWRQQARSEGKLMPDSDNTPEGWLSRDKYAAVLETAAMSVAEIAEYCRHADRGACILSSLRSGVLPVSRQMTGIERRRSS